MKIIISYAFSLIPLGVPKNERQDMYLFSFCSLNLLQNDTDGSEHSLYGSREAVEMHFCHFNTRYANMKGAVGRRDGLLVLAVLFHSSPSVRRHSLSLDPIIQSLKEIRSFNTSIPLANGILLQSLLPRNFQVFYKYFGSLTTPPCTEGVTWIVFAERPDLSYNQFYQFDQLDNQKNNILNRTNRELQPLNQRIVFVSSRDHCALQSPTSNSNNNHQ